MYLIFGGECYYASGGGYDLIGKKPMKSSAIEFAKKAMGMKSVYLDDDITDKELQESLSTNLDIEWVHVLDGKSGSIVYAEGHAHGMGRPPARIEEESSE